MRIRHPRAVDGDHPDIAIDVDGTSVTPDSDGLYELPADSQAWLQRYADANDVEPDTLVVDDATDSETCQVEKTDGHTCGRELPCPYHTENEDEGASD